MCSAELTWCHYTVPLIDSHALSFQTTFSGPLHFQMNKCRPWDQEMSSALVLEWHHCTLYNIHEYNITSSMMHSASDTAIYMYINEEMGHTCINFMYSCIYLCCKLIKCRGTSSNISNIKLSVQLITSSLPPQGPSSMIAFHTIGPLCEIKWSSSYILP